MNVQLLKTSFKSLLPVADEFITHFYDTLFVRYPQARGLFKIHAMEKQRSALADSLVFIVDNVENAEVVSEYLQKMGQRHADYKVEEEHFAWVGEALIESLKHYFGPNWTQEGEATWLTAYGFIAAQMKTGMEQARAAKRPQAVEPVAVREPTLEDYVITTARELLTNALRNTAQGGELQHLANQIALELVKSALDQHAVRLSKGTLKAA